ncbi:DUF3124 domain-containing protein [Azospirillum sp. TSO22-1]|uniref:DUF3124 domain-containing protein n=1 Tax=Azospirillum sp. TSO22-1 TaxID=716789 RepID=UPI001304918D|nr:DUF3124 domain-containing protein [Azospirillum sp. TSO22-1]
MTPIRSFLAAGLLVWAVVATVLLVEKRGAAPSGEAARVRDAESVDVSAKRPERDYFRPAPDGGAGPRGGTVYVPVYSTLYLGHGVAQPNLAVTLSVRNTSPTQGLTVRRITYYDTAGNEVQRFIGAPHALAAMGTAEFYIDLTDGRGGPGANFVVEWSAAEGASDPLIEAVMVGGVGTRGISLISRGQSIDGVRGGGPQPK